MSNPADIMSYPARKFWEDKQALKGENRIPEPVEVDYINPNTKQPDRGFLQDVDWKEVNGVSLFQFVILDDNLSDVFWTKRRCKPKTDSNGNCIPDYLNCVCVWDISRKYIDLPVDELALFEDFTETSA